MISDLKTGCATGLTRFARYWSWHWIRFEKTSSKATVTTCDQVVHHKFWFVADSVA